MEEPINALLLTELLWCQGEFAFGKANLSARTPALDAAMDVCFKDREEHVPWN
jgi:hypothetical protein